METSKHKIEVVDIFCGVGGLTYGLQKAGLTVIAGIDSDETCKYAYEHNNHCKFIHSDIRDIKPKTIQDLFSGKGYTAVAGCAPCQNYSTHTQKYKYNNRDPRWSLLNFFKDIVLCVQPDLVTMENVPRLSKTKVFAQFEAALKKQKYHVWWRFIKCFEYGIPQSRIRLVLLASKIGEISLIPPTHELNNYKTVKDTIAKLPPIDAGMAHDTDFLHKAAGLSEINLKRIRQSTAGGSWRDWGEDIKLSCHKKDSGKTYPSVYGRMKWNDLAPTITTQFYNIGTGRFGHPEQDRALSLREGALLQTFPSKYKFCNARKPLPLSILARHIGNAVPVKLGYIIGKSIVNHLIMNVN